MQKHSTKIGILITSISNFGQKGYYNSQEVGLAKALASKCHSIVIYKLVPNNHGHEVEQINENVVQYRIPSKHIGINGIVKLKYLDPTVNAIIHFSDTQFSVHKVYKWCLKNGILYIPYIGVIKSHSTNILKQYVTNLFFRRNLSIKNVYVAQKLHQYKIH